MSTSSDDDRYLPGMGGAAPTGSDTASENLPPMEGDSNRATTVLVVDDDDGFRAALTALLGQHGFDVVGDAGDGETALALVAQTAPDVVLMDLQMPGLPGLEAARRIAASTPEIAVLILTVSADGEDVADAMIGGARGYLVKGTSPEALVAGIQAAARGEWMLSAEVASTLFARLREKPSGRPDALPISVLSAREIQILRLLASGRHNEDIAAELVISPFTVRNHISSLLRKLRLENRTQAAAYAVRHGL
jgi:two-component system, NarL family, nitrate/nitrite response regulator NarL